MDAKNAEAPAIRLTLLDRKAVMVNTIV